MIAFLPSSRALRGRLANLADATAPVGYPSDPALVDGDLLARLQSLAVASSITTEAKSGRLRRRVAALIGAVGVFGWAGAAAAGASVGLATTGNLPAPVQNVVADVLEVVNIEIPRPVSSIEINGSNGSTTDGPAPSSGGDSGVAVPVEAQSEDNQNEETTPGSSTPTSTTPGSTVLGGSTTTSTTEPASGAVVSLPELSDDTSPETTVVRSPGNSGITLPVNTLPGNACNGPAASRNPNCATTTTTPGDTEDDSANGEIVDGPGNACSGPAASRNPNCVSTTTSTVPRQVDDDEIDDGEETDDDDETDDDGPGNACDGPAASRNPNCATTTTTTTTVPQNPFERLIPRIPGEDQETDTEDDENAEEDDEDESDEDDSPGNSGNSNGNSNDSNRGGNGNGRWSQNDDDED